MKVRSIFSLISVFFFLLSSCASARYETDISPHYVLASWYGPDFHGRPTASGEIFDMNAFTCAHREYPFGSKLKVTYLSNDKTTSCLVNDRGPFIDGRDLDLSYAVARELGLIEEGVGAVRIEYMGRDNSYIRQIRDISNAGLVTIQVGSFKEVSNATRLKMALELRYDKVYITDADINGSRFYRVRIGTFHAKNDAFHFAKILLDEGYEVLITNYDEKM
ncbi:MAG: septal ring lytic transglycosylase RlpA family protein [Nitrospirota bacterium]